MKTYFTINNAVSRMNFKMDFADFIEAMNEEKSISYKENLTVKEVCKRVARRDWILASRRKEIERNMKIIEDN